MGGVDITGYWTMASGGTSQYPVTTPGYTTPYPGYATPYPGYTTPGYTTPGYTTPYPGYTTPTYGTTTENLMLQLQQAGTQVTGYAMQSNSTQPVGQVMGIINGNNVNLQIQFSSASVYGSSVTYSGTVYPDGRTMVLMSNTSTTGTAPTPKTFLRTR